MSKAIENLHKTAEVKTNKIIIENVINKYTEILKLMCLFQGSFINSFDELILVPKTNLYFRLDDVETIFDLKCKLIKWCSRDCCKSEPYSNEISNKEYQESVRNKLNDFLDVNFNETEWLLIYTYLGNGCNSDLCIKFVESEFDINIITNYASANQC